MADEAGKTDRAERSPPQRVEGIGRKRLLEDPFVRVDEYVVNHERFDGQMTGDKRFLVVDRGDSAAALLYNPTERKVILVSQFRLPTYGKAGGLGWITEAAAGVIKKEIEETPETCIIREIKEETGYQVTRLTPVATFFPSPGACTELIHLYYAEVRASDRQKDPARPGSKRDTEDIALEEIPLPLFLQKLANREFHDPKVIIAGQWLRDRQNRIQSRAHEDKPKLFELKARPAKDGDDATPPARTSKFIGYITGDIANVHNVDVWVNPENTDMIMDRFFGRSISAAIRYLGARKYPDSRRVAEDTIGEALRTEMGKAPFVKPAFVVPTHAGELAKAPHNVKRIYHVAAAFGQIGDSSPTSDTQGPTGRGVTTTLKTLEQCVTNVLREMDRAGQWTIGACQSVIFPIMGTGEGGLFVDEVADRLVAKAIEYYEQNPRTRVRNIYFLAYSAADEAILADVMQASHKDKLEKLEQDDE